MQIIKQSTKQTPRRIKIKIKQPTHVHLINSSITKQQTNQQTINQNKKRKINNKSTNNQQSTNTNQQT